MPAPPSPSVARLRRVRQTCLGSFQTGEHDNRWPMLWRRGIPMGLMSPCRNETATDRGLASCLFSLAYLGAEVVFFDRLTSRSHNVCVCVCVYLDHALRNEPSECVSEPPHPREEGDCASRVCPSRALAQPGGRLSGAGYPSRHEACVTKPSLFSVSICNR